MSEISDNLKVGDRCRFSPRKFDGTSSSQTQHIGKIKTITNINDDYVFLNESGFYLSRFDTGEIRYIKINSYPEYLKNK